MEAGDYQSPACVFIASFEPPQQSRHIQQLTALVLVLIPGEPPQITPICGLVHIPGPVRHPAAKAEPVYGERRRFQVLSHQDHTLVIEVHRIAFGFLLAPIIQLSAFPAKQGRSHLVQVSPPFSTGRTEEKCLTSAESVDFPGQLQDLAPSVLWMPYFDRFYILARGIFYVVAAVQHQGNPPVRITEQFPPSVYLSSFVAVNPWRFLNRPVALVPTSVIPPSGHRIAPFLCLNTMTNLLFVRKPTALQNSQASQQSARSGPVVSRSWLQDAGHVPTRLPGR